MAAYWVAPGAKLKNLVLLCASLLFYAWGEPWFVLVLIGQIALNYVAAVGIGGREGRARKLAVAIGVALNLLLLGLFKYADFVVATVNRLLPEALGPFALPGLARLTRPRSPTQPEARPSCNSKEFMRRSGTLIRVRFLRPIFSRP